METVKVRDMEIGDIKEVLEAEHRCFSVPWTEEAFRTEVEKNKLARYVVVEVADHVVGYGGMWMIMDESHITNIAIHPDYRKRGYGEKIVQALIHKADKEGILRMTLEVRKSNEVAQNLYKKFGFESCGVRPKYYQDNGEDGVIMWRES